MNSWTLYILKCRDNSLYTGITTDLEKRLKCHSDGKASKCTRSRLPVKLMYSKRYRSESAARKEEARIKNLPRSEKLKIIK
jgi:putative endonuclease